MELKTSYPEIGQDVPLLLVVAAGHTTSDDVLSGGIK